MNSDDTELRSRSRLDYNRTNITTPITIDIHDYPRRPVTKFLEFVDGIFADEIDGWIEQSEAWQSAQRLLEKRRQLWLIDRRCAQEEEDQVLHFRVRREEPSTLEDRHYPCRFIGPSPLSHQLKSPMCAGVFAVPEALGYPAAVAFSVLDILLRLTPPNTSAKTLARGTKGGTEGLDQVVPRLTFSPW